MTDLNEALARPGDEQPAPPPAPAEPKSKKLKSAEPDELATLRAQNESLTQLVMEMRAKLMPDSPEKKANDAMQFDKKRPFAKHRTTEHGVWYEQDGRKYNGKFELVK